MTAALIKILVSLSLNRARKDEKNKEVKLFAYFSEA